MVENVTDSGATARAGAGVYALVSHAGSVACAFRIDGTFWATVGRRADECLVARTRGDAVSVLTDRVGSAG